MGTRSGLPATAGDGASTGRSGRLVGQALDHLRAEILSGAREPGQRLRDSVLATELGMSRAPVREALRMLEQSGLVVKTPNRSYAVVSFTDTDLYELATLRTTLETFAAELAFRNPATVGQLRERLDAMRAAVTRDDAPAAFRADRLFHETLVACAGHSRVSRAYAGLRDEIELALRSVDRQRPALEGMVERHDRLIEKFVTGPLDELLHDLSHHIHNGTGFEADPLAALREPRREHLERRR